MARSILWSKNVSVFNILCKRLVGNSQWGAYSLSMCREIIIPSCNECGCQWWIIFRNYGIAICKRDLGRGLLYVSGAWLGWSDNSFWGAFLGRLCLFRMRVLLPTLYSVSAIRRALQGEFYCIEAWKCLCVVESLCFAMVNVCFPLLDICFASMNVCSPSRNIECMGM